MTQRRPRSAAESGEVVLALALDEAGQASWRSALRAAIPGSDDVDLDDPDDRDARLLEDLMLVAGELVANGVEHGLAPAALEVVVERADGTPPDAVLVSVLDGGPVVALSPLPIAPGAVRGRGLAIVEALSTDWGVLATTHGKAVWARVARTEA